jgi:hypothetical protein
VWESVREWTFTLPSELPLWEVLSQCTLESLKSNYKGQNPWDWNVLYIIEKFFERRCLKWACMTNFGYLKHKLWPKERPGVKLSIWLLTTKSWESPWLPCVQVACHIPLEISWWGLQLFFRPHFNRRFAHKIVGFQSCKSPNFGSLKTKRHLGVDLVAKHKVYYKGEGDGFPKSRPWWVLWVHVCPWLIRAPKVF